jgi:nucleotide-binding universal stress UspA family protein
MTVTGGPGKGTSSPDAAGAGGDISGGRQQLLVVGIDGTPAGVAALSWAAEEARVRGARVLAVAVSTPPPVLANGSGMATAMTGQSVFDDEQLVDAAAAWLVEAIATLPVEQGQTVRRQVVRGDAGAVLLEAAAEADLLVLGNHGRGGIAGALLGSVAQHCAHYASCPLVLVPALREAAPESAPEPGAG